MIRKLLLGSLLFCVASALPVVVASAPTPATPRVFVVTIDKLTFGPMPDGLRAGDVVEWANRDLFQHTATARDGSFDVELAPGANARMVVSRGSFALYCRYHPNMTATLIVN